LREQIARAVSQRAETRHVLSAIRSASVENAGEQQ
jgi:hypothetical protein